MKIPIIILLLVVNSTLALLARKPNIILILTDDQDILLNGMIPMTNVENLLAKSGVTFQNAYVNNPICCPSRSTILTGKHIHNTGVRNNTLSGNCSSLEWQQHHEPFTFASTLKNNGYSTFYSGKYLNQYGFEKSGGTAHVPPGYDWWLGLKGNSKYYNYTLSVNGTARDFSDEYLTDVMKTYSLSFLNQKHMENSPFFMMLAPPAAHGPFTPAPRHESTFPGVEAVRTPAFNYSSNNRHWLLTMPPTSLPTDVTILDNIHRHRLQTLLAVDEMVEQIFLKLNEINVLDDTYIIFTSDNGFHIGQFVLPWDKRQPYETDIKVPLIIRGPNIKNGYVSKLPVSSVDLAPTILNMAGAKVPSDMDGQSFLQHILTDSNSTDLAQKDLLIEYFGEGDANTSDKDCPWVYDKNVTQCTIASWCKCQDSRNNTYACVRRFSVDTNFKFCWFSEDGNFIEAYDLQNDPYELHNVYYNMDYHDVESYIKTLNKLQSCKGVECY